MRLGDWEIDLLWSLYADSDQSHWVGERLLWAKLKEMKELVSYPLVCGILMLMAIASYHDEGTRDIAESINSRESRRTLPLHLHTGARRRLAVMDAMIDLSELANFPGWRLEALRGDRAGQHSIRINDQYRICFVWNSVDCLDVEIIDYH